MKKKAEPKKEPRLVTLPCLNCEKHEQTIKVPGTTRLACNDGDRKPPVLRISPFVFRAWVAEVIQDDKCECECGKVHHTTSTSGEHPVYGAGRPSKTALIADMRNRFEAVDRIGSIRPACIGDFMRWLKDGMTAENFWLLDEDPWFIYETDGQWVHTFDLSAQQTFDVLTGTLVVWQVNFV